MKRHLTLCGFLFAICLGLMFTQTPSGIVRGQRRLFTPPLDADTERKSAVEFERVNRELRLQNPDKLNEELQRYIYRRLEAAHTDDERFLVLNSIREALSFERVLKILLEDADSPEDREKVLKDVHRALASDFDQDMKVRQAELEKIQERVADMEAHLEKRAAAKDEIVELRLQVLVNQAEGLGWAEENPLKGAAAAGRNLPFGRGFGGLGGISGRRGLSGRRVGDDIEGSGGIGRRSGFGFGGARTADDEEDYGRFGRGRLKFDSRSNDAAEFAPPVDTSDDAADEKAPDDQPSDTDSGDADNPQK